MVTGWEILGASMLCGFGAGVGWYSAKMLYVFIMAQVIAPSTKRNPANG